MAEADLFEDLLAELRPRRRAHTHEVGRKVAGTCDLAPAWLRSDLVAAATLHDIGYAHRVSGFHALDGARFLASEGFSRVVCHLVVHHSASVIEADVRGIDRSVYDDFALPADVDVAIGHQMIAWADMTTGPAGDTVTVEDRLGEICDRYGPGHQITTFIERARPELLAAGQTPLGSIHV